MITTLNPNTIITVITGQLKPIHETTFPAFPLNPVVNYIFPYLWNLYYKSADLFQYVFKFPCLFARLPQTSYLINSPNYKYDAKIDGMSFFRYKTDSTPMFFV